MHIAGGRAATSARGCSSFLCSKYFRRLTAPIFSPRKAAVPADAMKAAAVASPFLLTCKGWLQYTVSDPTRPLGCGGPHVDRHVSVTYSLLFSGLDLAWTLLCAGAGAACGASGALSYVPHEVTPEPGALWVHGSGEHFLRSAVEHGRRRAHEGYKSTIRFRLQVSARTPISSIRLGTHRSQPVLLSCLVAQRPESPNRAGCWPSSPSSLASRRRRRFACRGRFS